MFRPVGASRLATSGAVARVTRVALSNRFAVATFFTFQSAYLYPRFGVWLASISIGFWMRGDAERLRVEVPRARSFPLSISPKDIESEGIMPLCKSKAELQHSLFIKKFCMKAEFFLC